MTFAELGYSSLILAVLLTMVRPRNTTSGLSTARPTRLLAASTLPPDMFDV
jgi:hypothetical protein